MAQDRTFEQVAGVVTCSNDRGFKLDTRDGWLNVSKFATVAVPSKGDRIVAGLDKAGFVREVEVATAPAAAPVQSSPEMTATAPVGRETRITRMAALNTATAILSSGSRATEARAVIALAEQLEGWVNR